MTQERTILHVDDDPSLLRIVHKILTAEGYDVVSLDDPTLVTKRRLETGARVVLLDLEMPQIDGLSVLQDIKSQDGGVEVIMLTGIVSMSTVLQSMRWGAEACVFKPITDREPLLSALEAAFDKINRWWSTLDDLNTRRRGRPLPRSAAHEESLAGSCAE